MNVITQFFDDLLGGRRVTNNFYFLSVKILNSVLDAIELFRIFSLLVSGVESNQSFEDFISIEMIIFFFDFLLELFDMFIDLLIVLAH